MTKLPLRMTKFPRLLALALAAGLTMTLGGCVSAKDRAMRNSQPYQAGYADGCAAATGQGASYREGPKRNEEAFQTNTAYRAGWNSGYSVCRSNMHGPGYDPMHPIQDPSPGH